ncbi:hypothetical protein [Kribbella sp. DT2]|uniref:hypothetical protein n=1 Tax=Kribbella sp. DT2 TaxID=3393427 RepID=UPI003CF225F7
MSELARDGLGVTAANQAANVVRDQVVRTLAAYVGLSARMRGLEEAFRTQVMGAGCQLQQLIEERRRLEAELDRIRTRIDAGEYADDAGLAADIDATAGSWARSTTTAPSCRPGRRPSGWRRTGRRPAGSMSD